MNVDDSHMDAAGDEAALGSPAGPSITSTRFPDRTRPRYDEQSAHEHSLRCELEHVRQVNGAIEGVIKSLGKAKDNMKNVNNTVGAASTLLNTWTRILSQTEHNQRLILNPSWQGANQDIAELEGELLEEQRTAERREVVEQEKKLAAARRAEAEEKRKAELRVKQAQAPSKSASRISTTAKGAKASTSSYVQMGSSSSNSGNTVRRGTSSIRRSASGIGRGVAGRGSRGRV